MNRQTLITELRRYRTVFDEEQLYVPKFIELLENYNNCFERSLLSGHITGSAWVLNDSFTHVLLVSHKKLNRWLQPGGHADGDEDILNVSGKELLEETGLKVQPYRTAIFDLDIHKIPKRKEVPEHNHFDIRYLFIASVNNKLDVSEESMDAKWWLLKDLPNLINNEPSIMRMIAKSNLLNNSL